MNTALPVLVKERPVVYRERMSYLYSGTAYGVAAIINELPWMAVICLTSVPVIYFMCGFLDQAGPFFFYLLVNFVFVTVFVSLAQFLAALLPNIAIAQAVSYSRNVAGTVALSCVSCAWPSLSVCGMFYSQSVRSNLPSTSSL